MTSRKLQLLTSSSISAENFKTRIVEYNIFRKGQYITYMAINIRHLQLRIRVDRNACNRKQYCTAFQNLNFCSVYTVQIPPITYNLTTS